MVTLFERSPASFLALYLICYVLFLLWWLAWPETIAGSSFTSRANGLIFTMSRGDASGDALNVLLMPRGTGDC
jgi:hypothetical protein